MRIGTLFLGALLSCACNEGGPGPGQGDGGLSDAARAGDGGQPGDDGGSSANDQGPAADGSPGVTFSCVPASGSRIKVMRVVAGPNQAAVGFYDATQGSRCTVVPSPDGHTAACVAVPTDPPTPPSGTPATAVAERISDGRITVTRYVFEDGAVACPTAVAPFYDEALEGTCAPALDDAWQMRCLPTDGSEQIRTISAFEDAACSAGVVVREYDVDHYPGPPLGILETWPADRGSGGCFLHDKFKRHDGILFPALTSVYVSNSGACAKQSPPAGRLYRRSPNAGAGSYTPAAAATFSPVSYGYQRLSDRLDVVYTEFPSGLKLASRYFRDRQLHLTCIFDDGANGIYRCRPESFDTVMAGIAPGFSDAACTAAETYGSMRCAPNATVAAAAPTGKPFSVTPITGTTTGYFLEGNACVARQAYALGAPIEDANLAIGSVAIDP